MFGLICVHFCVHFELIGGIRSWSHVIDWPSFPLFHLFDLSMPRVKSLKNVIASSFSSVEVLFHSKQTSHSRDGLAMAKNRVFWRKKLPDVQYVEMINRYLKIEALKRLRYFKNCHFVGRRSAASWNMAAFINSASLNGSVFVVLDGSQRLIFKS